MKYETRILWNEFGFNGSLTEFELIIHAATQDAESTSYEYK
jgi:hypothetical protein